MSDQLALPGLAPVSQAIVLDPVVLTWFAEAAEASARGESWAWCAEQVEIFRSAQVALFEREVYKLTRKYLRGRITRDTFVTMLDDGQAAFNAQMTRIDQIGSLLAVHVTAEANARRVALAHQPIVLAKLALHKATTQRLAP